jgi:ribonuclease J
MPQPVTVSFLGGLGDIGRNCATLEHEGRIVVLDCGVLFPDPDTPGVEATLPDLTYLRDRADDVEAVVFTHGHEDHIGAAVHLARIVDAPMYGSPFTLGLVRSKLEEAGLAEDAELIEVRDGETHEVGPFRAEFLPITHSIPWGFATAFHTPQGIILHSGDYKIDPTPIDDRVSALARIGDIDVRLLLSDSTNTFDEGITPSERTVGVVLEEIIASRPDRRIIAGCFSSHIHRIQQLVEAAIAHDRVVVPTGYSLRRNVALARELGLLELDDEHLADAELLHHFEPSQVLVLSTGSQGEQLAGLNLMARGDHKFVTIGPEDTVVLSSHPIPGNEFNINKVIDGLVRRGAEVVTSAQLPVHVSGHARRGEIRQLLGAAAPKWFVPVHGEFRHLTHQAELAVECGVEDDHVLVAVDGDQVVLGDDGLTFGRGVPGAYHHVHGTIDDVTEGLLAERLILGREGVVFVIAGVDLEERTVTVPPRLVTRGWITENLSGHLLDDGAAEIGVELDRILGEPDADLGAVERVVRRTTGRFVNDRTRRRPMIVPVVLTDAEPL